MTTLNTIAAELNTRSIQTGGAGFANDWAGHFDISNEEAQRIADRVSNLAEFEAVWSNENWWTDANN